MTHVYQYFVPGGTVSQKISFEFLTISSLYMLSPRQSHPELIQTADIVLNKIVL